MTIRIRILDMYDNRFILHGSSDKKKVYEKKYTTMKVTIKRYV